MMDSHSPKARTLLLVAACLVAPLLCAAQATPAGSRPPSPSDVDIYVGYGYLHPVDSDIYDQKYQPIPGGVVTSVTGYFSRSFGFQAEFAKFPDNPDYCYSTIQAGPVLRHQMGRLVPFAHFVGGAAQVGPSYQHNGASNSCEWGWAVTSGIGLDYILPAFNNHLAIRPIEGDFTFSNVNFGNQVAPNTLTGGDGQIYAVVSMRGLSTKIGNGFNTVGNNLTNDV